ncbi:unnamed protein product [Clonostachys rhizophaga]|uniref:NmrA-like domain-containing protein n=1 Tax=Clonostachys rhizophaga TaxID=160324 RepID=A0A9N9YFN6_9HYPO|nr:unnamed protein product [Clonostachys rhizophaga]
MRIAVAGGGCGLGCLLASQISRAKSAHNVLVLSRTPKPIYESLDIQVQIVDYFNPESLQYALRGVDLVISTVSGREQINLILAAGEGTVRHFVPAEFEGKLWQRPPRDGSTAGESALAWLQTFQNRNLMKYTVFSCGVLMEIFHPLGLGSFDMGFRAGVSHPNSYLINLPEATAEYAVQNAQGQPPGSICLTSVYDLVHFVVLALELGLDAWPREFTLRGDRLSVQELVETYGSARNGKLTPPCPKLVGRGQTNEFLYLVFYPAVTFSYVAQVYSSAQLYLTYYSQSGNELKAGYYRRLMATADGRYDFQEATLNETLQNNHMMDFVPMTFAQWLDKI